MIFLNVIYGIKEGIRIWESKLQDLPTETISLKRNTQNRNIKQIVGHMVDSASNNTHRIIHLQYQINPLTFPNYATNGNNDRWISIQNYEDEDWNNLIQLWKYSHLHFIHLIQNVNTEKLNNEWISGQEYGNVSLEEMIIDFLNHFNLHLKEIQELIDQ